MWWNNSKKESNENENENVGYVVQQEILENPEVGIGELTAIIIDYYCTTGEQPIDSGDEWKKDTDYESKPTAIIPEDLDKEIKKSFLFQIKKFQK